MHLTILYANFDDDLHFDTPHICPFVIKLRKNIPEILT